MIHQFMQFVKTLYTQWCNMRFRGLTMLATKNVIHSVSDRRNSSAYHQKCVAKNVQIVTVSFHTYYSDYNTLLDLA